MPAQVRIAPLIMCLATLGAPAALPAALPSAAQEQAELDAWRTERRQKLTSDQGWLTLVGLFWLSEGSNTFGRDPKNAIHLDHAALAPLAGDFERRGEAVRFLAAPNDGVMREGRPAGSVDMVADSQGEPTVLESGSLSFALIERGGRYGIRVRDRNSDARSHFQGLQYFPVSADWVFDARFEPYRPVRSVRIVNILGMDVPMTSPGALVFAKGGHQYRLDAVLEEPDADELFVMFADKTSGKETYGAGRFLYVPLPEEGKVRLDFNKAFNPPCAFSNFATCPLPPAQNRLALRVEAGELRYGDASHAGH